jgi:hypothetical protein
VDLLCTLLIDPINPVGWQRMALLLPLCLAVSVVYKTTKCNRVAEVPLASAVLCVTIVIGMYAVGIGLFIAFHLLA